MGVLNKVLSGFVALAILALFSMATTNIVIAIPFLIIYTVVIIININSKDNLENKILDLIHYYIEKIFYIFYKKIQIEKDLLKGILSIGLVFYIFIIITIIGNLKSIEDCLEKYGIKNVDYCYATFERRVIARNEDY
jgi:hypothetical protein